MNFDTIILPVIAVSFIASVLFCLYFFKRGGRYFGITHPTSKEFLFVSVSSLAAGFAISNFLFYTSLSTSLISGIFLAVAFMVNTLLLQKQHTLRCLPAISFSFIESVLGVFLFFAIAVGILSIVNPPTPSPVVATSSPEEQRMCALTESYCAQAGHQFLSDGARCICQSGLGGVPSLLNKNLFEEHVDSEGFAFSYLKTWKATSLEGTVYIPNPEVVVVRDSLQCRLNYGKVDEAYLSAHASTTRVGFVTAPAVSLSRTLTAEENASGYIPYTALVVSLFDESHAGYGLALVGENNGPLRNVCVDEFEIMSQSQNRYYSPVSLTAASQGTISIVSNSYTEQVNTIGHLVFTDAKKGSLGEIALDSFSRGVDLSRFLIRGNTLYYIQNSYDTYNRQASSDIPRIVALDLFSLKTNVISVDTDKTLIDFLVDGNSLYAIGFGKVDGQYTQELLRYDLVSQKTESIVSGFTSETIAGIKDGMLFMEDVDGDAGCGFYLFETVSLNAKTWKKTDETGFCQDEFLSPEFVALEKTRNANKTPEGRVLRVGGGSVSLLKDSKGDVSKTAIIRGVK